MSKTKGAIDVKFDNDIQSENDVNMNTNVHKSTLQ